MAHMGDEVEEEKIPEVNIKKAANGFVVTSYSYRKDTVEVAKDWDEAVKSAKKIMGIKSDG